MVEKGYKQTEVGVIPEDWNSVQIKDIACVKGGSTPKTSISKYWDGHINWFTPTEVGEHKYLYFSNRKITEVGLKDCSATILPIGTILMTTRAGIGDLGILKNEASTNQGFQSLICNNNINNEYLYYLMQTKKNDLLRNASGSTFLEISPSKVKSILIPLPPLPEQTAIAEALSDMDALIAQTEKLIEKKKAIKQGMMQKLLTPKEGWVTKKLGDLCLIIKSGGTPLTSNPNFYNGEVPFLSIGDMTSQGKYLKYTTSTISREGLESSASWIVPKNSIIYSMYASVGYVSITKVELAISQAVLGMIFKSSLNLSYMYYYLLSIQTKVLKYVGEGTQKNLNAASVKQFDVYLPSLTEQLQIAEILNEQDNEISLLETKLQKLNHQKQGMMQALLTGKIRLI